MFDIGFWELAFIGLLALLILGPKRLPEAARSAGLWVGKLRTFITNVKQDLDSQLKSEELAELRRLKDELVQAREAIQQTSGDMISSFTDGVSAQAQEIADQSGTPENDNSEMNYIDEAVSGTAPLPSKQIPRRKSGKPAVAKKGSSKKAKKRTVARKKPASKKTAKKTNQKKTASTKKTKKKKIAGTKRKNNGS